jgi:hypothetical protein
MPWPPRAWEHAAAKAGAARMGAAPTRPRPIGSSRRSRGPREKKPPPAWRLLLRLLAAVSSCNARRALPQLRRLRNAGPLIWEPRSAGGMHPTLHACPKRPPIWPACSASARRRGSPHLLPAIDELPRPASITSLPPPIVRAFPRHCLLFSSPAHWPRRLGAPRWGVLKRSCKTSGDACKAVLRLQASPCLCPLQAAEPRPPLPGISRRPLS